MSHLSFFRFQLAGITKRKGNQHLLDSQPFTKKTARFGQQNEYDSRKRLQSWSKANGAAGAVGSSWSKYFQELPLTFQKCFWRHCRLHSFAVFMVFMSLDMSWRFWSTHLGFEPYCNSLRDILLEINRSFFNFFWCNLETLNESFPLLLKAWIANIANSCLVRVLSSNSDLCFSPTAWKAWGSSNKASGWFGAAARNLAPGSARFPEVPHKGFTLKSWGSTRFHIKVSFLKVQVGSGRFRKVPHTGSILKNWGSTKRFHC